ncbi:MAG: hypothetical protein RPR97_15755 [Colwellia sp.]
MDIMSIIMALLGATAYELMLLKDVWQTQFKSGSPMSTLRPAYLFLLAVWLPLVAVLSYLLFKSDNLPPEKFIIVGFAFPTVIKALSSHFSKHHAQIHLGSDNLSKVTKVFFRVGDK